LLSRIAKKNIDILNKQFWIPFIHEPEQKTREMRVLNRGVDNKNKIIFIFNLKAPKISPKVDIFINFLLNKNLAMLRVGKVFQAPHPT
jgi:hypothetical protein